MDILKKEKPFSMDAMIKQLPTKQDFFLTLQQKYPVIFSFPLAISQWINLNNQLQE